jgi:hypothetical protein
MQDREKDDKTVNATVEGNFVDPKVQVLAREGRLKIHLQKMLDNMLEDQSSGMVAGQGCISSPGGPSC